eukprot:NODE_6383_length_456_cov_21.373464_g4855_i0.p1 GENE.NODE_6383_length_456_cov_21.373464_g4855_i0~~NODE_6383_length_456_cov_21.373464_g4855_i0.p1  ORF type:complete len:55 (+),score=4.51 NODE_6383_length_456_cov_21.373464_g4855_i0:121-285(+)
MTHPSPKCYSSSSSSYTATATTTTTTSLLQLHATVSIPKHKYQSSKNSVELKHK